MKTRWAKADNETLIAEDEDTRQWLAKRSRHALIEAETKELRNGAMHRKFFALVNLVWENLSDEGQKNFPTRDLLVSGLKIAIGHADTIVVHVSPRDYKDGAPPWPDKVAIISRIPRSISFAKMDQGEFEQFFDRCCDVIIRDFWPDMTKETLKAEVAEMCGAGGFSEVGRMPDG